MKRSVVGILGIALLLAACAPFTARPSITPTYPPQPPTPTRRLDSVLPTPTLGPPTSTPSPRPTKPPPPTPTVTPTWPVIVPPTATPGATATPLGSFTAADLLPHDAQFMADAVADVGLNGSPAAVLIYRWLVGPLHYHPDFDESDLHLLVQPLAGASYTPQGVVPDSPVTLLVADLNGDGQRDLVVMPCWNSSFRFARSSLAAWPHILSAVGLQFQGGHLASRFDNKLYFSALRPMLYYAGPKQTIFADVDGDGFWEVDVAYSLEDGAATWQVDRYHWNDKAYVYAETLTRPATEPFPPDRYRAFIQALGPLPEMAAAQAWQIMDFDANGDGQDETLLVYLVHPYPHHPDADKHPGGDLALALFAANGRLLWRSQPENLTDWWAVDGLITAATPVRLGPGVTGLLFYRLWIFGGSGAGRAGSVTLYRWDGQVFTSVWEWTTTGGGRMGAGLGSHMDETVWLEDVDGDGWNEVLVKRVEGVQDLELEYRAVNYTLYLPGALAFRWDGRAYVPGYFMDEGQMTPIRPQLYVTFATRLSYSLSVDGDKGDWAQIEYWGSLNLRPNRDQPRPNAMIAWDEQKFYLTTEMIFGRTITLTLDTDLAGDFANPILNDDDVVLAVTLPTGPTCTNPVFIRSLHPSQKNLEAQAAIRQISYPSGCNLELSIPLTVLGLNGRTLVPAPGWVAGSIKPRDPREYHPHAGLIIGFAIAADDQASVPDFRPDNPTTWATLVFIADR